MKTQIKSELRIGNKLRIGSSIITVAELYEDEFKTPEEGTISYGHRQLSGLPITEELLLKAGWRFYNGRSSGDMTMNTDVKLDLDYRHKKIMIKSHYEDCSMYQTMKHVQYVHQLQNLYFALTGKELTL